MSDHQGNAENTQNRSEGPRNSLEELKRRLANAQPVVVDNRGRLHVPNDPSVADQSPQEKTIVKPQRWFGASEAWYEYNPARLLLEKQAMESRFPAFQLIRDTTRNKLVWRGKLETNSNKQYEVVLIYPDDFPTRPPDVYPVDPMIEVWKDEAHRRLKHQYQDGHFCLYYPGDHAFTPNTTAAKVMAVAAAWLFAYESWLSSDKQDWPGIEAD